VVMLLAALVGSALGRVLGWSGMVWLGRRSYSVYLWHYPVLVAVSWCNGRYDLGFDLPIEVAIAAAITLALAELSYLAVERPLRLRFSGARPAEIPAGVAS
jgi:peptidoglycan/LPS O-acetylase OafA/YrhL